VVDPATGDSIDACAVVACPAGDSESGFTKLRVEIEFEESSIPSGTIFEAGSITIDKPDEMAKFWNDGPVIADSNATEEGGYKTTITHEFIGGCTDCGDDCDGLLDIPVRLNGFIAGLAEDVKVRSPDATNDGIVNLSDTGVFGLTYNKALGDEGYNQCMDFNLDDVVNLADFGFLGAHYGCEKPADYHDLAPERRIISDASIKFVIKPSEENEAKDIISVSFYLANASSITTLSIGLDISDGSIEFLNWEPNLKFKETTLAAPVMRHGRKILFINSFRMEEVGSKEIELGTLVLEVDPITKETLTKGGMKIVFGDVLDTDGRILMLQGVAFEKSERRILTTYLGNCYPNPFNPSTTIEYAIKEQAHVSLQIYNVSGRLVKTLMDREASPGVYAILWEGRDNKGNQVSSGVYFYRLVTKGFTQTKKMVLLK
jgi:hypothetical protein